MALIECADEPPAQDERRVGAENSWAAVHSRAGAERSKLAATLGVSLAQLSTAQRTLRGKEQLLERMREAQRAPDAHAEEFTRMLQSLERTCERALPLP